MYAICFSLYNQLPIIMGTMIIPMIISESTYVVESSISLFYFMAAQYSLVYMHHIFLMHSSADGQVVSIESSVEMTLWRMFLFP